MAATLTKLTSKPAREAVYGLLGIPCVYEIDKDVLKRNYHAAVRAVHPDGSGDTVSTVSSNYSSAALNHAFATLKDDFLRARLFTVPAPVSGAFLGECIELDERIRQGEDLTGYLEERIRECMKRYEDPESVTKWGYYRRLQELLRERGGGAVAR